MSRTKLYAYSAIFASLHAILCFMEWPWRRWSLYIEPLEAVVLGPVVGPIAAFVGSILGRAIFMPNLSSFAFGVPAETIGVFTAARAWRGDYKTPLALMGAMLIAFYLHHVGRSMPPWTLADIYLALIISLLLIVGKGIYGKLKGVVKSSITGFIAATADAMVRVTILIPAGVYSLFGLDTEALRLIFTAGAIYSFAEDIIITIISTVIIVAVVRVVKEVEGAYTDVSQRIEDITC